MLYITNLITFAVNFALTLHHFRIVTNIPYAYRLQLSWPRHLLFYFPSFWLGSIYSDDDIFHTSAPETSFNHGVPFTTVGSVLNSLLSSALILAARTRMQFTLFLSSTFQSLHWTDYPLISVNFKTLWPPNRPYLPFFFQIMFSQLFPKNTTDYLPYDIFLHN